MYNILHSDPSDNISKKIPRENYSSSNRHACYLMPTLCKQTGQSELELLTSLSLCVLF